VSPQILDVDDFTLARRDHRPLADLDTLASGMTVRIRLGLARQDLGEILPLIAGSIAAAQFDGCRRRKLSLSRHARAPPVFNLKFALAQGHSSFNGEDIV